MKCTDRIVALSVTVMVSASFLIGCQSVQKFTGTQLVQFSASPDEVVRAAKGALEELGFKSVIANSTKLDGSLEAKTGQGKEVNILVKKEDDTLSNVTVKIGMFGDKAIGDEIIAKIKERLE